MTCKASFKVFVALFHGITSFIPLRQEWRTGRETSGLMGQEGRGVRHRYEEWDTSRNKLCQNKRTGQTANLSSLPMEMTSVVRRLVSILIDYVGLRSTANNQDHYSIFYVLL